MLKYYFLIFILFASSALMAALQGDLNNDGNLDFADFVHLQAMLANKVKKSDAADLNFDGEIDEDDAELLQMAIRGVTSLPKLIATTENGGKLTGGGLTVDIPEAAKVSLSTQGEYLPDFQAMELKTNGVTQPVIVTGLPCVENIVFTLDVPSTHLKSAGTPMLFVGYFNFSKGLNAKKWNYRLLSVESDSDLKYASGKLVWKPKKLIRQPNILPEGGIDGYVTKSDPIVFSVVYAKEETRETTEEFTRAGDDFTFVKVINIFDYSSYRTEHFLIQPYDAYSVALLKVFAMELEDAFTQIGKQGFNQDYKAKWGDSHIRVNIYKSGHYILNGFSLEYIKKDHAACAEATFWHGPVLEFGDGLLSMPQRAETACHELMHLHHHIIVSHNNALWLDEMCTTWSEYLVTKNPKYVPKTFDNARDVVNCIAYKKFDDKSAKENYGFSAQHGYGLVPFARWLTNIKYPGKNLWFNVFNSNDYKNGKCDESALITGLKTIDSKADIGKLYLDFIGDYFMGKEGIPKACNVGEDGTIQELLLSGYYIESDSKESGHYFYKNGYKEPEVKKLKHMSAFQPKISHRFLVGGLCSATWKIEFKNRPYTYLNNYLYSYANIEINDLDLDYYVVTDDFLNVSITKPSEVRKDISKGIATISVPLEKLIKAKQTSYLGIIAVNSDVKSKEKEIEVTVNIQGPFIISDTNVTSTYTVYPYSDPVACEIHTDEMIFTPMEDTLFANAFNEISDLADNWTFNSGKTEIVFPKNGAAKELKFNLTGILNNVPHDFVDTQLGYKVKMEFTGKYRLTIRKTKEDSTTAYVHFDSNGIGKPFTDSETNGIVLTDADFAPQKETVPMQGNPEKLIEQKIPSNLNITIPEYDTMAKYYGITLSAEYRIIRKKGDKIETTDSLYHRQFTYLQLTPQK